MIASVALSRRKTLALLGTGALLPLLPRDARAAPLEQLALFGPPAGPSVTLAHGVAADSFADVAGAVSFTAWRNPDELRAGLTSGQIDLSIVPIQAAANLYRRGFPIRLANVMTNCLLYILSGLPEVGAIPDLAGRRVAVPFRGDTPEIIFGQLLAHHGLDPEADLQITYAASPTEAMQLLLAGRVDAALTSEPSTTASVMRGREAGQELRRAIDIQAAWGEMTGGAPVLPQAGLAITRRFLDANGDAVPAILGAIETATAAVLADPAAAAADASEALGMPAPLLASSIPHSNLVARHATEACADVERMLAAMDGTDAPPDDGFYL